MELLLPEFGLIFWILICISAFSLLSMFFALISILKNDFKDSTTKLIWIIVVIMLPLIGSILYFAIGRNQIIKK